MAGLLLLAGCAETKAPVPQAQAQPAKPAAPAIPEDVEAAAIAVLGSDAEVLLFGDLAKTGSQQVLIINRIKKLPDATPPGTYLTRLSLLEKNGDKWNEVLHGDEHLKNGKGFLAATPLAPVNGWRLQTEQSEKLGLMLYFTPMQRPAGGNMMTIGVRWNPAVKRYQSMDRTFTQFLGETPMLEKVGFDLRK